ncbi:MAG: hypothetical protein ACJ780_29100 [Solirubrobacteraceae bacterium]|jgi:hypothetical protein
MSVKPTTLAKRRVCQEQQRQGYAWGQRWGARLRPLFAPVRWYRRLRSSQTG